MRPLPFVRAIVLAGLAHSASADESAPVEKFASVRDLLQTCVACHGESGAKPIESNPILAGQHYYYLYSQLRDFKSGLRKNAIMEPIAKTLEPDQMKVIAQYFAEQSWPSPARASDPQKVDAARTAIDSGECVVCHLGDFRGNSGTPRLAGQRPDYLERTMLEFKSRVRNNAPDKATLLATFSETDIESLADYLSALSVYQRSSGAEIQ
jgi:cytochrome c553